MFTMITDALQHRNIEMESRATNV